jgi:hypothetical protein
MVTEDGFAKRVPIKAFPEGVVGRVGVIGCKFHEGDVLASLFVVGSSISGILTSSFIVSLHCTPGYVQVKTFE